MDPMKLHFGRVLLVVTAGTAACLISPDEPTATGTTGTSSGSSGAGSTESESTGTHPGGVPGTSTTGESASSESSTSATTESTGSDGQPNGFFYCFADEECASGHCFDLGLLNGICSECSADAHCAEREGFGCSPPNIAAQPGPAPAVCNDGSLGAGCETSEACAQGLTCELILTVPLIYTFSNCSECAGHGDCLDSQLCSPTIEVTELSGYLSCVGPGSVEIGGTCDAAGDGDQVCASGACAPATIDGLANIGLCSECDADADCPDGWTCADAYVNTFDVESVPAACVRG